MLKVEKDFEEFVELLNKFSVEYMIVGAYALALYSRPRNTGDIDVFINSSSKNAKQIIKVIEEFGFEKTEVEINTSYTGGHIMQHFGNPNNNFGNKVVGIQIEYNRGFIMDQATREPYWDTIKDFNKKFNRVMEKASELVMKLEV